MKKRLLSVIVVLAMLLWVSCEQPVPGNPLVGTWRNGTQSTIILRNDNTYSFAITGASTITGHYVSVGDLITFDNNPSRYKTFRYSLVGDTLSLSVDGGDGTVQTYIR